MKEGIGVGSEEELEAPPGASNEGWQEDMLDASSGVRLGDTNAATMGAGLVTGRVATFGLELEARTGANREAGLETGAEHCT